MNMKLLDFYQMEDGFRLDLGDIEISLVLPMFSVNVWAPIGSTVSAFLNMKKEISIDIDLHCGREQIWIRGGGGGYLP